VKRDGNGFVLCGEPRKNDSFPQTPFATPTLSVSPTNCLPILVVAGEGLFP